MFSGQFNSVLGPYTLEYDSHRSHILDSTDFWEWCHWSPWTTRIHTKSGKWRKWTSGSTFGLVVFSRSSPGFTWGSVRLAFEDRFIKLQKTQRSSADNTTRRKIASSTDFSQLTWRIFSPSGNQTLIRLILERLTSLNSSMNFYSKHAIRLLWMYFLQHWIWNITIMSFFGFLCD